MKEIFKKYFSKYLGISAGISAGFFATAVFAVTISGTVNTFSSGDQLDAVKMNQNFASLKAAIEGIPQNIAVKIVRGPVTSVPNGSYTYIGPYDNVVFDTGGFFSTGTPDRLTIPSAGLYYVQGQFEWAQNTTGLRKLNVKVNGSAQITITTLPVNSTTNMAGEGLLKLNTGDVLQLEAYQDSGGPLNLDSSGTSQVLTVIKIAN